MSAVGCLDTDGLLELFSTLVGRRLLGVVDGMGCVSSCSKTRVAAIS